MAVNSSIPSCPGLPVDRQGPVFREPWEASAFAIVVRLHEAGCFTWPEWVDCFSRCIKASDAEYERHGHIDDGGQYYHRWLEALESILVRKNVLDPAAIAERQRVLRDNPPPHDHVARREPVCIA